MEEFALILTFSHQEILRGRGGEGEKEKAKKLAIGELWRRHCETSFFEVVAIS